MSVFAVIDTNVLVSALLTKNPDSPTALVVNAISEETLIPLYTDEILAEYGDVLLRDRFGFRQSAVEKLLAVIRQFGVLVSPSPTGEQLPDMDDLVFYEVVMEKRNDADAYLVTGNLRHFPAREYIVTPAEMVEILKQHRS